MNGCLVTLYHTANHCRAPLHARRERVLQIRVMCSTASQSFDVYQGDKGGAGRGAGNPGARRAARRGGDAARLFCGAAGLLHAARRGAGLRCVRALGAFWYYGHFLPPFPYLAGGTRCWGLAAGAFMPPAAAQVCDVCVPQPFSAQFSLQVLASEPRLCVAAMPGLGTREHAHTCSGRI